MKHVAGLVSRCTIAGGLLFGVTGCHSAFIQATVLNHSGRPVQVFEVDYPSASFGGGALADGASFHSRFKVLGSGATKVLWTDGTARDHSVAGPTLREGEEGTVTITLGPNDATWTTHLRTP